MNRQQKKLNSIIRCMPDIMPYKERKRIARQVIKVNPQNAFRTLVEKTDRYIWKLVADKSIRHWSDTWPHIIIASAIVDMNNNLHTWKVGNSSYEGYLIHEGYQVKIKIWCVHNGLEHQEAFETLSTHWFKNFKLADDFKGMKPY